MSSNARIQQLRSKHANRASYGSPNPSPAPAPTVPSFTASLHTAVKDLTGKTAEYRSEDDVCPVCKSDRFLNPKLRLMVSSCYHRMCESCIDRLFTLGPAPCPICQKVTRKMAFIPQTFEDLVVEKEVGVRRRMAKEFNKRREDFPDLRSYNDYLEEVENITFNLINGIDIAETEAKINQYRLENAALIELNMQRDQRDAASLLEDEARDRMEKEERAEFARREDEMARIEKEKEKADIISKLESSTGSAASLVAKTRAEAQKRASQKKPSALSASKSRLLPGPTVVAKDEPHVPLSDDWYSYDDKFILKPSYYDPLTAPITEDQDGLMRAGGYKEQEIWERALRCGIIGLDIGSSEPPVSSS